MCVGNTRVWIRSNSSISPSYSRQGNTICPPRVCVCVVVRGPLLWLCGWSTSFGVLFCLLACLLGWFQSKLLIVVLRSRYSLVVWCALTGLNTNVCFHTLTYWARATTRIQGSHSSGSSCSRSKMIRSACPIRTFAPMRAQANWEHAVCLNW